MFVIPDLRRWSKVDVWDLLASQPDLMGELKVIERISSKKKKKKKMGPKEWPPRLMSTCAHSHTETLGIEPIAFHIQSKCLRTAD